MNTSRRTFLKTAALVGAAAALPASVRAEMTKDGLFPGGPNFQTSPAASVMISGGTITKDGKFLPAVREANRLHYGARKKILLILHASEPARRETDEKKMQALFAGDYEAESLHHWEGQAALKKIEDAEAFFVSGGETFLLLRTLMESGQLSVLRRRVLAGVPYNGTSAGSNVAGLNIGCTNDFPVVDVPTRNALGIFPTVINPHHPRSDQKDEYAGRVNKVRVYCRLNPAETVVGIGNGAVLRLNAGQVTVEHGPAFYYHGAEQRELKEGPAPELTALVSQRG